MENSKGKDFKSKFNIKCSFLEKGKYTSLKLVIAFICSLIVSILLEKLIFEKQYIYFSLDRIGIFTCVIYFILIHFVFKLNEMYEFIYKKRFIISLVLLVVLVLLGYSGSSMNMYNHYIQPNIPVANIVFGKERSIRSDEWAVTTPLIFSGNNVKDNKLPYFNPNIRAEETDMFTVINAPISDVLVLAKPLTWGYFLGNRIGISFFWYARLIGFLLISFEFSMVITNKNKKASLVRNDNASALRLL